MALCFVERLDVPGLAGGMVMSDGQGKKLLFLANSAPVFISHRSPVAIAALENGYDVHVAAPYEKQAVAKIRELGFTYHRINLSRRGINPLKELVTLQSIIRLYRVQKPDIVYQATIKPVIYGGIAARIVKIPAVLSAITGLGYIFLKKGPVAFVVRALVSGLYKVALSHPNIKVIFQNPDDRQGFIDTNTVKESNTILIRGSGVDVTQFSVVPEPESQVIQIALISRMLWDKGIGEFVDAARQLKQTGLPVECVLVGGEDLGNPAHISESKLKEWQAEGVVEWWGHRNDVKDIIQQSHIICLPSYREGVPRVLIEAAACGRPIVTTNVPGCREIVRDGANGFLVPAKTVDAMYRALATLVNDKALRQKMGHTGRQMVEDEFAVEHVIRQTLGAFEALSS